MIYLKIQTLDKGWHDKDEVLLHAAFQLLVDFVEKERPDKIVDWTSDELHRRARKEIKSLYKWWKETRPARRSPLDDRKLKKPPFKFKKMPDSELYQLVEPDKKKYAAYYRALRKHGQLEEKWYEEGQHNLHRLIEIRGFLWT
ncbi:MAG TPA: hypothetical protein VHT73_04330 [Thermodesulfobacteriota bacterium]|nr:hypothetical protein [Thermodesulfobacteriota bacterium]